MSPQFTLRGRKCASGTARCREGSLGSSHRRGSDGSEKDDSIENNKCNVPAGDRKRVKKKSDRNSSGGRRATAGLPPQFAFPTTSWLLRHYLQCLAPSTSPSATAFPRADFQEVGVKNPKHLRAFDTGTEFPREVANKGLNLERPLAKKREKKSVFIYPILEFTKKLQKRNVKRRNIR